MNYELIADSLGRSPSAPPSVSDPAPEPSEEYSQVKPSSNISNGSNGSNLNVNTAPFSPKLTSNSHENNMNISIDGIDPRDPRLDANYYTWYHSQRPRDPRLDPPLQNYPAYKLNMYTQKSSSRRPSAGLNEFGFQPQQVSF